MAVHAEGSKRLPRPRSSGALAVRRLGAATPACGCPARLQSVNPRLLRRATRDGSAAHARCPSCAAALGRWCPTREIRPRSGAFACGIVRDGVRVQRNARAG